MEEPHCNRTWDNILCWPDTTAGQLAFQKCPYYINKFDKRQTVTRYCTENGTWWVNPDTNLSWSNYSECEKPFRDRVPDIIEDHLPGIKTMSIVGYSVSLSTLVIALSIMIYFKRLHCKRNMIHINMFLAFGARAALLLMKNILLVDDLGFANDVNQTGSDTQFIHEGTHWECKLFFTCIGYIITASLMWLLNEGLYLHLILSVAVFGDRMKIRWFVLLGWGMPVIFVIPWVMCRIYLDDVLCWNIHMNKDYFYILHAPMVASCAINFLLFLNIVRILYTKITASHCPDSKTVRYRKLAKSTLILIPLFATYYMGFIWLPEDKAVVELFKIYVEMIFNSTQGLLVALLFCFLNHEVNSRKIIVQNGKDHLIPMFYCLLRNLKNRDIYTISRVQYEILKKWQRRSWANNYSPSRKFQSHGYLSHRSDLHDMDDRKTIATRINLEDLSSPKTNQTVVATAPADVNIGSATLPHYDVFEVHSQHSDEAANPFLEGHAEDEQQTPLFLVNENFSGSYSKPCKELNEDYNEKLSLKDQGHNSCNGAHYNSTSVNESHNNVVNKTYEPIVLDSDAVDKVLEKGHARVAGFVSENNSSSISPDKVTCPTSFHNTELKNGDGDGYVKATNVVAVK